MDAAQIEANVTLEKAIRRANLLAAAAEVSQNITQIMDIEQLLPKTVDIICDAYGFYYAGVFLIDPAGEFAVLRAGRGEPGRIMIENNHKLAVGGNSMIGAATALNEARISLDVDTERVWYPNPVLPETRSEMALPLAIGDRVIGGVTVQSTEGAAFSDEDVSSLQAMANQLAIAIDNARQRRELEEAHAELLQAKTFEAIATATGDAIHWIGNKAEPIGESIKRIEADLQLLVYAAAHTLQQEHNSAQELSSIAQLLIQEATAIQQQEPEVIETLGTLNRLPLEKLQRRLSVTSILEDLEIVNEAARQIMRVKEDLIGPAREYAPQPTMVDDVLKDAVNNLGLSPEHVTVKIQGILPLVLADPIQLTRVFTNLIKNANEATTDRPYPKINLTLRPVADNEFVLIDVTDNGIGIAEAELDKIWVTFHSTKGVKGHTGLGLPACRLILDQIGGDISVTSQPGSGSTFTVKLPVYKGKETEQKGEPGRGRVLLIDDPGNWIHFATSALEAGGYKVTIADADYSASPYDQYDLILVDDSLANKSSLELLQALKEAGAIAKTVVLSSNPRVERAKERKLIGVHDLVPKPYTRANLLNQVKNALSTIR
jgi:signal transduction histidine kinase